MGKTFDPAQPEEYLKSFAIQARVKALCTCRSKKARLLHRTLSVAQNMIRARNRPTITATDVATRPGIMNEWLSTYLPILVVPERSKLIAAISEP